MIALALGPIDPAALLADFARASGDAGAIVSFTGVVRPDDGVDALWLDHHDRFTLAAIEAVGAEARARFVLIDTAIVHRVGELAVGDPIVFVAAAAQHRRAALDAVDLMMDRLKTSVPLWKRETRGGEVTWVEARAQDHADAARWENRRG